MVVQVRRRLDVSPGRRLGAARGHQPRAVRGRGQCGGDEGGGKRVTKASEELAEKFTTGGGGADGFCDYDDIRDAMEQCDGLEGAKLDACYAAYGCNVDAVTDHYAKAAGIDAQKKTK